MRNQSQQFVNQFSINDAANLLMASVFLPMDKVNMTMRVLKQNPEKRSDISMCLQTTILSSILIINSLFTF